MNGDDQATATREIGAVLAEFAQSVATPQTVDDIMVRLGDYCTELLPLHGVGVLLQDAREGTLTVGTANTEAGRIVETAEAELAEGPCSECLQSGEQILVPDLEAATERYPRFVPRAREAGVQSVHALPMTVRGQQIGALDMIALEPLHLTAGQIATAQLLADVAVAYLANSRALQESSRLAEQLQHALDSRIVIEQAKGMLSERHGLTPTDAFERLRRHARNEGRTVRDLAADVLRGGLDL